MMICKRRIISRKGISKYILWFIVLVLALIVIIALFYSVAIKLIQDIVKRKLIP